MMMNRMSADDFRGDGDGSAAHAVNVFSVEQTFLEAVAFFKEPLKDFN